MLLMGVGVFGQGNWAWARTATSPSLTNSIAEVKSTATDGDGNIYIVGLFGNSITFGSIVLTGNYSTWTYGYVAKYNSLGQVLWAKQAYSNAGQTGSFSVYCDKSNDVYVTGYYNSTITFDTVTLSSPSNNSYLIKLDPNGNALWGRSSKVASTGGSQAYSYSVVTDASANVFITGTFLGTYIAFGNDTITNINNNFALFVVKYDQNGNVLWKQGIITTATNWNPQPSIATDASENLYLTGNIVGPYTVFVTDTIFSNGHKNVFLSKFEPSGNIMWTKSAGGINENWGNCVATTSTGKIFITGCFRSPNMIFGTDTLHSSINGYNAFIAQYDSSGVVDWSNGSLAGAYGYSVASDPNGNAVIAGAQQISDITFGSYTLPCPDTTDYDNMYIIKFNSTGNAVWGTALRGGGDDALGRILTFDNFNNLYVGQDFEVNPLIIGNDTLIPTGGESTFLAKLAYSPDLSIFEQSKNSLISIYPNPATSNLTIAFAKNTKKAVLIITDITGKLIYTATASETEKMNVNTNGFAEGVYIVKIQTDDSASSPTGNVVYRKLIVQK